MKLHLPKGLRKAVLACLAAVAAAAALSVTVGTANAAWGTAQKETAGGDGWGLVLEDHFSESTLNDDYWQRIQYESPNKATNWRGTQSTEEELAEFRNVGGNSALTLWGRYGKYTNQNNQQNTTTDVYAAGGIYSKNVFSFQYGYVEVRAKYECAQGVWPAIWMMPQQSTLGNWPRSGEIDIMEHINSEAKYYSTLHRAQSNTSTDSQISVAQPTLTDVTGWHTYGVEWASDHITFFLDGSATGTIYWTEDGYSVVNAAGAQTKSGTFTEEERRYWPFDAAGNEFYLIIDQQVAGSTGWVGDPDAATQQKLADEGIAFDIDYVKVWSSDEYNHLQELTWQGDGDTWEEGTAGDAFLSGNSVVFGDTGVKDVKIAGTVHAGNMSVRDAGYTFAGKDGGTVKLEVGGALNMETGASFACAVELGGNVYCKLTGSGNITYTGTGVFTINTIDASGYSGTIEVTGGGRLLLSTDFETAEGGTIDLGEGGILAFDNNNAAAGGALGDTTVTANLTGVTKLEGKGGFCVTLAGSVQGTGVLTTDKYNGAGFSSCFVFDGDVSGFSGFTTSAGQYNFTHYSSTRGHAAYTFNAGLTLSGDTTFNVVKNDDTAGRDTWIELSESSELTGSGSIVKTGEGDLRIYGDTSGYSGSLKLQQGKLLLDGIDGSGIDLSLENATAAANVANLEGTGGVLGSVALGDTATSGSLALGDGAEWSIKGVNLSDGKTLTLQSTDGTADVQGLSGTGGTFIVQGGTVNLSGYDGYTGSLSVNSGKLVLGSAPGDSGLTALTLNDGARVESALTTGTLKFGTLTLPSTAAAGGAVLGLTGVLESLKLEAGSVTGGTLHIELTDEFISSKVAGTQGYVLFSGDANVWSGHIAFDNETYGTRLKLQGNLLTLDALTGLQWAGSTDSHVWSTAGDNQDWKSSDLAAAFTDGQDVLFAPGADVSTEVTLSGALKPGNVTVQSGEGWVFTGSGSLAATGKITVGENGKATLTLSGTGAVSSEGLVLVGNGSKLTITAAPNSGTYTFKHIEIGEGSELVLQGAAAANSTKWDCTDSSYAGGAGSIVLEGTGLLTSGISHSGILWAFLTNTETKKPTIGHFKLRKHEDAATTLVLNGEMGSDNAGSDPVHGLGVVENLWVEDGNTLMVRSRALGKTQTVRTLHLAGDGSNANFTGGTGNEGASVTLNAALVLGYNATADGIEDRRSSIFWNITAEADTSIGVLASAAGDVYTWKLEETVNTGTYTLTKKGAGTLVLGEGSTLTGSGEVAVADGILQLAGDMNSYTGTMSLSGDAQAQFVGGQSLSLFTGTITLADGKTMAFDAAAQLSAGSLTASATGLNFGSGTNFAAGSLTLTGIIDVTGGATLSGNGVFKVAESSTLSLDDNTYGGMKVELESTGSATSDTTSKLALNGGSFTGDVTTMGRGEIALSASTEGAINVSGDAYLTATNGAAFNGTITLTGSQQKFGIFDVTGNVLQRLIASKGDGILVANGGGTVDTAVGLSEVWVGGPAGTQVSIGTLKASGENHSFTMDNGLSKAQFPNGAQGGNVWAGNSGRVNVTGEVSGYTSFTARRKGTAVTDGIDLLFSGTVNMGKGQNITITADDSKHDNVNSTENAVILFDTSSEITGSGTITKQGAGELILAGSITEKAWALNVTAGTLTLGKRGQDPALNYSFTGLTMAASTTTTVAGACNLTITGKLNAAQGTLALNAETTLTLQHTAAANQLGTLALGADGTLTLGMDATGFASLALGTLSNADSHQLTLQLEGLDTWIGAQNKASSYELQLFSGNAAGDLVAAIGDRIEGLGNYTYTLDATGLLTITVSETDVPMIWSEGGATMTWSSTSDVWGEDHNAAFDGSQDVTFAGTSTAPITVTLGEAIDVQGNMTVQKGAGVGDSQSYTFATGDYSLTVGGNLSIADGLDVTFTGSGAVSVTDTLSVGTESGAASLTLSGTGAVSANGLVLAGDGSSLTITATPSTGKYTFKQMEVGAGTELVLQGEAAADSAKWDCTGSSYAGGAGSIVLEGTGLLTNGANHSGILWAFFTSTETNKPTIGNFRLRKHENTATTLVIDAEMGSDSDKADASPVHGLGVIENLWVEDGNTLMVRSRALGKTQTVRTLHLAGEGSNASFTGAGHEGNNVTLDAALVLGYNTTADGIADRRSSIFWNITAEANTSIGVLASATGDVYTWKLEETVNTGTYTLTKKGAGTLVLGEDSTLTGSGNVSVTGGLLQLAGGMNSYTGTMSLSGDAQVKFVGGQSLSLFTGTITLAADKTMAFDADAQLTAGSLTASATGISFGSGTNFAAGSLTLTGTINVTGGAALSGNGVLKVAESSTLSLDNNTYSGMKVELESGSAATNDTTSKLALNGGSFTGNVTTGGRGEITLNTDTAGAINISGSAYLNVSGGSAFTGTITLSESGQKFGIFGATGNQTVLQKLEATVGDGILVVSSAVGDTPPSASPDLGGIVQDAVGLSEVWVGGPAGTHVTIGTLTAAGSNHSFTTDNGYFMNHFPDGAQSGNVWAGNSGRVNVTGEVSGYTSFTARRKGTAVTDGIDLAFSGTVNMGNQQNVTITAERSQHENEASQDVASILFDTSSEITGSGTLVKQGAGNLILAGTIAADAWAVNVNAGTLTLGKGGQDATLNYSFKGLNIAASASTTVAGACNLTLTGKLDAAQGSLALNGGGTLSLQYKASGDTNQLGTLALGADGTLKLGMDATGFASLDLGTLSNADSHQLTLQLEGLDTWIGAQEEASSYELQLFSGNAAGDLVAAIGDRIEGLGDYTYTLDDTGLLTITVSDTDVPMIWSESEAAMTWSSTSDVWGEDHNAAFDGGQDVTFAGTSTSPITVTLGEDIDVRGNMTVQKGAGVSDSQSYTFATEDHSLTVGGDLSIEDGLAVTFTGTGAVAVSGSLSVGTEGGAASLTLSGTGAVSANDLVLAGDGSSLTIAATPTTGTHSFHRVELGANTELVLRDAGSLSLDADSTLIGAGSVSVTGGLLQLAGGMNSYTGTMSLSGDTAQVQFVGGEKLKLFTGTITLVDVGTLTFDADAQLSAGSLTASANGLSFGTGTNFAAGSLTLTGTIAVSGGAALSGNGVLKVAESSTLSLDNNTYSGMKVELESGSAATDTTTSKLALNGGSFTGDITTKGRGEITLNASTAGAINISGSAYLNVSSGAAFTGTITLSDSGQKFGIFGASGNVLQKLVAATGDGVLVANGGTIETAEGLSEVWVGGETGTQVSIGTLKASGENHSFTTDNGVLQENFTDMEGHWAGNSGRVNVTGEVSGYTSFTARRKGTAVTGGIDLAFSGTVNMGDRQNVTITADDSAHDNENTTENAVILFDTSSTITGSGTITKQGAGNLILAGTVAADAWAVNVNAGTLTLGKGGQDPALNYSFKGLSMAASSTTTVAGPCNLTLTGKLDAAQGTLALNAETTLSLRHTAAANQLGTLALGADGTLRLGMDATGFASLALGTLSNVDSHQLTLQLEGLDTWIGAQSKASSYELQLFTGNAAGDLVAAIGDRIEGLGNYTYTLDATGLLTITVSEADVPMIWSESGATMTWSSGSDVWGEDHNAAFDGSRDVTFAGTSTAPITVTLGEAIDVRGNMTVQKGAGVSGSQSYTFATEDHSLTVGGNLSIADGLAVTFTGSGAVSVTGTLSVGTEGGAASLTLSGIGTVSANDLVLAGDGSSLTITATPSTGTHTFRRVELGAGTELVLQDAGSLSLDADSVLTGSGDLRVSAGQLRVFGNTADYTGTFRAAGGSLVLDSLDASHATVSVEGAAAGSPDVSLNGGGSLKDIRLGDTAVSGTVRLGAAANWSLASVSLQSGQSLSVQGTDGSALTLGSAEGFATAEGSTLNLNGVSCTVTGASRIAGTLSLSDGAVLTAQGGGSIGTLSADGGGLRVESAQSLTVVTSVGAGRGLSELRLGAGAELRVQGGSLKIDGAGALSWGSGAAMRLDGAERVTLGDSFTFGESDGTLLFRLSDVFMTTFAESGKTKFFLGNLWDSGWTSMFSFKPDSAYKYKNLHLDTQGCLAWDPDSGVHWTGGSDNTWTNEGTGEWENVQGSDSPGGSPQDVDVYFKDEDETARDVIVGGEVTPSNVFVESGVFTFTGQGGLNLTKDEAESTGVLVVGGGSTDAKLTLDVVNKNLPTVVLDERGTLVLANDAALTKADQGGATDTTLIKFKGGVLEYSGDKKLNDADVSDFVAQTEGGSTDAVKVSVDGSGAYGEGVTWGDTQRAISGNGGLTLALDQKGIEKSGTGAFTLAWQESEGAAPHAGAIKVDAGTLSLAVNTANSASVLNGNAVVSESGRLVLRPKGDGGLTYAGNITGAGALSIREGSVSLSGSNDVKQIELAGGTTRVSGDRALGGADSHLKLQGGTLMSAEAAQVRAGSIEVEKDTVVAGQIGLAGNLSGSGILKAADESHPVISGDMSLYGGKLDTGAGGTWVLSEHALEGEIRTSVSGNGSVQFTGAATFGGEVAGSVTLENTGTGELVVTSEASSADAKLKGNVALGNAEHHAIWSGSALENGTVTLSNVTLTAGDLLTPDGVRVVVDTAAAARVREVSTYAAQTGGGVVDVRGMRADKLGGITIREDGQLSGVIGTYTVGQDAPLELYFAAGNVSAERDGGRALIVGGEGGFSLDVQNADNLRLHLDAAAGAILDILSQSRAGESKTAYLNLLDGGELRGFDEFLASSDALGILREFVDEVSTDNAGNIVLVGSAMDVYVAPHTATTLSDASTLNEVKATVLAQATDSLSLSYDGASVKDATVHNLLGVQGSQLHLLNSNSSPTADGNRLQITFDNTEVADLDLADYPTVDEPEFGQTTVRGQHTTFDGSIDGGVGVDVTKSGRGTLSVGGNYTLSDGSTTISQGALKLRGQENSMVGLSFAYTSEEQQSEAGEEKRGLLLDGGRTTVVGSITEAGVGKGDIALSNGAELVLQGVSSLAGTSIIGDTSGGTLSLVENESGSAGKLRLSGAPGAVQLSGVGVNLASENTELDLGSGKNDVSFLSGTGTVRCAADGTLGVQGGTFSGTLGMSDGATSAGRLVVLAGSSFTLKNATNASGTNRQNAWDVQLAAGANFTVDVSGQPSGNSPLVLGDVLLGCGNMTVNFGDRAIDGFSLEANIFGVGDDGTLTFLSNSSVSNGEDVKTGITVDSALRADFLSHVRFTGAGNLMKDREARIDEEGNLLVSTKNAEVNKFLLAMPNAGKNARAGAEMMWDSLRGMSQWDAFLNSMLNPTSDFERLCYNLLAMHDSGDAAGLERTFTAVAGASVSVVAPALAEDLHRQLSAIRNRTTTMAGEVDSHTDLPLCHAWINAESGYHKVDADGYLPGYTLDNWGGTLGFDADVSPHATVGLAITAMYGDLKPDSADSATGDLDSSYLSAFARLSHGPWIHTLVVSSGVADVKLDRTVNYGSGNYRTHGDTTGYSIGALYEVGYTCLVNDAFALQPIANVEVRYASLRGYSETGSDVGLNVDDSDQTVLTFGAGARAQIAVHENAFNRSSILEARLLFKADVGDRSGTSRNAIIGGTPAETECAEVGAVGLEAGLGLSIPIGSRSGTVFLDGSFELREHWTSASATLGYRLSF